MMRKEVIAILLCLLLMPNLVHAQELQKYSFFGRLIDGFRLFFSYGESRVDLLLEIKDKEVNSAIISASKGNVNEAVRSLENAKSNLNSVQELITLNNSQKIASSINKTISRIQEQTNLTEEFNDYLVEEQFTGLNAELVNKTYDYCKKLALEDFYLMLEDEACNPATAMINIKEDLRALERLHNESFNRLMLEIRSCVDDPGTCNCDTVTDVNEKAKCKEVVALALKCEYQSDNDSCTELNSMRLDPKSFVPGHLRSLYEDKSGMIEYDIEKSDVPPECYNENDKPECEQYRGLKEINGQQGMVQNREPTMQESIPQCFDAEGNYLNDTCGKVSVVYKNGLINYIYEASLNMVIDVLENNSIDVKGSINQTKQELIELNNSIATRVFAPGTWETNDSDIIIDEGNETNNIVVIEGNGTTNATNTILTNGTGNLTNNVVIIEGNGTGDLTPEVSNVVVEGNGSTGDLTPEVSNVMVVED